MEKNLQLFENIPNPVELHMATNNPKQNDGMPTSRPCEVAPGSCPKFGEEQTSVLGEKKIREASKQNHSEIIELPASSFSSAGGEAAGASLGEAPPSRDGERERVRERLSPCAESGLSLSKCSPSYGVETK